MNPNDEELQKELKDLKISVSMDSQKKESMKTAIRKHARKKRKRTTLKKAAIWLSTAAALLVSGVLVMNIINSNQSVLPTEEHDTSQLSENTSEKEPADNRTEENTDTAETFDNAQEPEELSVTEQGTENQIIMIEGMEEEVSVTNYVLEPYGIQYQMDDILGNYTVDGDTVRHYSDADNTSVSLRVVENASHDDVVSDLQSEYKGDFNYREEPAPTSQDENPYEGIRQHFSDPPQGYYAYQIGENVLVIQYEYVIEAGDGMGPRLQVLRESIDH
ncbi:hypothetical protein [Oceanobacillus salinisoli]|uniref:hypothetical protein n=1 Tax=Oceanobacillus salinisoli TaxID=2678611 RepID=UPI0012E25407|nr:hypothetical protein [Oceanobacillus salinisoli]